MSENDKSELYDLDYIEPLDPKWIESGINAIDSMFGSDVESSRTVKLAYVYDRKGVPSFDNVSTPGRNLSYGSAGDDLVVEYSIQVRVPQHVMSEELQEFVDSVKSNTHSEEVEKAQEEFDNAKRILDAASKKLKEVRGEI